MAVNKFEHPPNAFTQHPPRRPSPSFPSSLIHQIETSIPTEFQLPEDVRSFFKDGLFVVNRDYIGGLHGYFSGHWSQRYIHRYLRSKAASIKVCLSCIAILPLKISHNKCSRLGQLEERDAYRLRDRNGTPVLCYRCGTSALPSGAAAAPASKRPRRSVARTSTPESWRSIISCDYCNLHWHLDCLDPPLSAMPPFNKKWMCPNHAEQILVRGR